MEPPHLTENGRALVRTEQHMLTVKRLGRAGYET